MMASHRLRRRPHHHWILFVPAPTSPPEIKPSPTVTQMRNEMMKRFQMFRMMNLMAYGNAYQWWKWYASHIVIVEMRASIWLGVLKKKTVVIEPHTRKTRVGLMWLTHQPSPEEGVDSVRIVPPYRSWSILWLLWLVPPRRGACPRLFWELKTQPWYWYHSTIALYLLSAMALAE